MSLKVRKNRFKRLHSVFNELKKEKTFKNRTIHEDIEDAERIISIIDNYDVSNTKKQTMLRKYRVMLKKKLEEDRRLVRDHRNKMKAFYKVLEVAA